MTAPSVQGCPASFTDTSNSLAKTVTWTPPLFTDNVGVISVLSNQDPGFLMDTYSSINILYIASDATGNTANCTFTITLEGMIVLHVREKHVFPNVKSHNCILLHQQFQCSGHRAKKSKDNTVESALSGTVLSSHDLLRGHL